MADMIDREELKKAVDTWDRFYYVPLQGVKRGSNDDYTALVRINDILHCIDTMPAADVQPIKHGRWICNAEYCKRKGYKPSGVGNYYWCSECDGAEQKPSDFCPNCGAKMIKDGEHNDT